MKKIIIISVCAVVLIGVSVGAALFLLSGNNNAPTTGELAAGQAIATPQSTLVIKPESFYLEIRPPFVMSLASKGRSRFLQVEAALVTYDKTQFEALENHLPAIKARLVALFSDQKLINLQKLGAREKLREEALAAVREAMTEAYGQPAAENIYFTRFIIQ